MKGSFFSSLLTFCTLYRGSGIDTAREIFILFFWWGDWFDIPAGHMLTQVIYVIHQLGTNIMLKCWEDEFSFHKALYSKFFGVHYLKVWEY